MLKDQKEEIKMALFYTLIKELYTLNPCRKTKRSSEKSVLASFMVIIIGLF
jgi:hypothetical protein